MNVTGPRNELLKRVVLTGCLAALCSGAGAEVFVVDSVSDAVDAAIGDGICLAAGEGCTLRAAVQEANAWPGPDTVELDAVSYVLAIGGIGEQAAATGDLDITDDLTVVGVGESATVIDGGALDRVFDIGPGGSAAELSLERLTVTNGVVDEHQGKGGCVFTFAGSALNLDHVTVEACSSQRDGSGVYNEGTLTGIDVSFIGNGAIGGELDGAGGAIANVGDGATVDLYRCLLESNVGEVGGAIYTSATFSGGPRATVSLDSCSLIGNSARQLGGAMLANAQTDVLIENSTFSSNQAGGGGAIGNDGACIITIRNSSIVGNHADSIGGGISEVHFHPDFILVSNSIIAGNTAGSFGPDCDRTFRSEGSTLVGDTTDCIVVGGAGDLLDVDPQLSPLLEFGPRAKVHLPEPGSPVIDAGFAGLCAAVDQLGQIRPYDGDGDGDPICDLGSVEAGAPIFADGFESGGLGAWPE